MERAATGARCRSASHPSTPESGRASAARSRSTPVPRPRSAAAAGGRPSGPRRSSRKTRPGQRRRWRTTTGRRETPGPGRRSFSRLSLLGAELADPIAQARGGVVGAAFLANQPLHLRLEIEDLLAGRTVVQVRFDLLDLGFAQLAVDVGVEPAHRLFAVISH